MNMKNILRLMGALTLTVGATTSVVACGDKAGVAMNVEVSDQLGLTDKGEAKLDASLDTSVKDNVNWVVTAASAIKASALLVTKDKAANQACFDFITNVLKVKPTNGTTLADGKFDRVALEAITAEVTNIKPELTKMDNKKDYAITGGNFSFQFKKGNEKLGDVYGIKLKADKTKGVIAAGLIIISAKIVIADTDVVTNKNILFIKDGPIPSTAKEGAAIKIVDTTDNGKQFAALNTITSLTIAAQMQSTDATGTWEPGKKLEISYKTGDVTFDPATVKTVLEVPA